MTPTLTAARASSSFTRCSCCVTPVAPAVLANVKSLSATRHRAAACTSAPLTCPVHAPSALAWPSEPARRESTRCAAPASAMTPPPAPGPLASGSAPNVTVALPRDASGRSDTSAVPVAGSFNGRPSSVITTCSRREPRSETPVSPRALRTCVSGSNSIRRSVVAAPRSRACSPTRWLTCARPARARLRPGCVDAHGVHARPADRERRHRDDVGLGSQCDRHRALHRAFAKRCGALPDHEGS